MKTVSNDYVSYSMSSNNNPVLTVSPGEIFSLETKDCYCGNIKTESDVFTDEMRKTVNPATGPVFIEGTFPDDIIEIKILDIKVNDKAVMYLEHASGPLGDFIEGRAASLHRVNNGKIEVIKNLYHDINPMIGVIGTAPAGTSVPNSTPGEHGGNMDCKIITAGTSVYLPVNTAGALLAAGDIHTIMGDGEAATCAAETTGTITMQVNLVTEKIPTPSVKTKDFIYFIASARTLDECEKLVLKKAFRYLSKNLRMESKDAARIMSLLGDLQVCQIVNPLKTMRFAIPVLGSQDKNI